MIKSSALEVLQLKKIELETIHNEQAKPLDLKAKEKEKLTFDEQISYLKSKGILFQKMSEVEAKQKLMNNSYYYKLTSYEKNFHKDPTTNKYENVEFATLNSLAAIDRELRAVILQLTLNLEHSIKTLLINTITENPRENGYDIITYFDKNKHKYHAKKQAKNPNYQGCHTNLATDIIGQNRRDEHYDFELYEKNKANPPIWVLLELMTYNQLVKFVEYYYYHEPFKKNTFKRLANEHALRFVKNLRDFAAHNRPLLLYINDKRQIKKPSQLATEYATQAGINKQNRVNYIGNRKIHDFTCLLDLYNHYVKSLRIRNDAKDNLIQLKLFVENEAQYFSNHPELRNVYKIFTTLVDNFIKNV